MINNIQESIGNRLPQFMRVWDEKSVVYDLLSAFSYFIVYQKRDLMLIQSSHWIDDASGKNLDFIAQIFKIRRRNSENDEDFRRRIKNFLQNFIGGGTKQAIIAQLSVFLNIQNEKQLPQIIENPRRSKSLEHTVRNNDVIKVQSESIFDEDFKITLILEEGRYELENPKLENPENKNYILFKGKIKSGQKLEIDSQSKKAFLDKSDVTSKVDFMDLKLPRKRSDLIFSEDTSPSIGRFDYSYFDKHVFDIHVPQCTISFNWDASIVASFEVKISKKSIANTGLTEKEIEDYVNSIKAAGVKSYVSIVESHLDNS